jgi:hypothetical protein
MTLAYSTYKGSTSCVRFDGTSVDDILQLETRQDLGVMRRLFPLEAFLLETLLPTMSYHGFATPHCTVVILRHPVKTISHLATIMIRREVFYNRVPSFVFSWSSSLSHLRYRGADSCSSKLVLIMAKGIWITRRPPSGRPIYQSLDRLHSLSLFFDFVNAWLKP